MSEKVKHGETPGQIARRHIIRMREKFEPFSIDYGGFMMAITVRQVQALRRMMKAKARTVRRQRDKEQTGGFE